MFADQCVQFHLRNRGFNKQWFDKIKTVGEQLADERQIPSMGIPAFSVFAINIVMTAQEEVDEIIQPGQLPYDFAQIAIPCFKKQSSFSTSSLLSTWLWTPFICSKREMTFWAFSFHCI